MSVRPIEEDDPITLKEACEIVFRDTVTISTLRAEAARGHLEVARIGKRDFTTLRSAKELFRKCQDEKRPRDSISIRTAKPGLSATDRATSVQAALKASVGRLKSSSRHT